MPLSENIPPDKKAQLNESDIAAISALPEDKQEQAVEVLLKVRRGFAAAEAAGLFSGSKPSKEPNFTLKRDIPSLFTTKEFRDYALKFGLILVTGWFLGPREIRRLWNIVIAPRTGQAPLSYREARVIYSVFGWIGYTLARNAFSARWITDELRDAAKAMSEKADELRVKKSQTPQSPAAR